MANRARRHWVRALSVVAAWAAAVPFALAAFPACAQLRIEVAGGLSGAFRALGSVPVAVRVTGNAPNADASVQLVVRRDSGDVSITSRRVRFTGGPIDETFLLQFEPDGTGSWRKVVGQVVAHGRVVAEADLPPLGDVRSHEVLAVVVSEARGGFGGLARTRADAGWRELAGANRYQPSPARPLGAGAVRVVYPAAAQLPDRSSGYDAADLVVLGDVVRDALTDDQWLALRDWVRGGGLLVVSGGADVDRLRACPVADLLPVRPERAARLSPLRALRDRYGTGPRWPAATVVTGSRQSAAAELCEQGGVPVLTLGRVGCGTVALAAFDLLAPEFRAWARQDAMWSELLRLGAPERSASERVKAIAGVGRTPSEAPYDGGSAFFDALAGREHGGAPATGLVGASVALYVILLVPVNYFVLRWRDRRELAWVTGPIIIALFTVGAYGVGYAIKGSELRLRSVTVLEGAANTDAWRAFTVASVYSPRRERYRVSLNDRTGAAVDVTPRGYGQRVAPYEVVLGPRTEVRDAVVEMWDHREFAFDGRAELGGYISGSAVPIGDGRVRVTIANGLGRRLEGCGVSFGRSTTALGPMAAGETRTATLAAPGADPHGIRVPGEPEDRAALRLAVPLHAAFEQSAPDAMRTSLVFTAWLSAPAVDLSLSGARPKVDAVTLLVAHLPAPATAAPPPPPADHGTRARSLAVDARRQAALGDDAAALASARQALDADPSDPTLMALVGEMQSRIKQYSEAEACLERAFAHPGFVPSHGAHLVYGEVLEARGKPAEALDHYRGAAGDPGAVGTRARGAIRRIERVGPVGAGSP